MRKETDFLGEREIPEDALYGIHALRAYENFTNHTRFHKEWYQAIGLTKRAMYATYKKFKTAARNKYTTAGPPIDFMDDSYIDTLLRSAKETEDGYHFEHFIVPAMQGGAGTSINMNINEIIANRALQMLGYNAGQYDIIDPVEHANIYQSTNDVIPTAQKIATIQLLNQLEESINNTRFEIEEYETQYRNDLRIGYTQMQEAVPSSFGKLFSNFSDALSRDWWRVSKCFERIKVTNIGGSAIGTGITVPRYIIMEIVPELQRLTKLPVTRGENLTDTTSNLDSFAEIHGILKAHAVNLEKMVSDLRTLSSDINCEPELDLPAVQTGSSIMPGKVNPVITEFGVSIAHQVYANDQLISSLAGRGCLELNAYLPLIGHTILSSLKLLIQANEKVREKLIKNLTVNTGNALKKLHYSPAVTTALLPYIGYHKASVLAKKMQEENISVFDANSTLNYISEQKLREILKPEQVLKQGFSLKDINPDQ